MALNILPYFRLARPCVRVCRSLRQSRPSTGSVHTYSTTPTTYRHFSTNQQDVANAPLQPVTVDPTSPDYRGPASKEETQTHFPSLDMFANTPPPATSIDVCLDNGFHLDSGVRVLGSEKPGLLLLNGEAFRWQLSSIPSSRCFNQSGKGPLLFNQHGKWDGGVDINSGIDGMRALWGLLEAVWPKPELLILGVGPRLAPIAPATKSYLNNLGIVVDVMDTRNAAAQFNLLATERGVDTVAAAMVPIGWT